MSRLASLAAALLAALLLAGCDAAKQSTASLPRPASVAAPPPNPPAGTGPDTATATAGPASQPAAQGGGLGAGGKGAGVGGSNDSNLKGTAPGAAQPTGGEGAGLADAMNSNPRPTAPGGAPRNGGKGEDGRGSKAGESTTASTSAALGADEQRLRQRDEYIAGLKQGVYTFNPPSPIKVDARIDVALWVDPVAQAAQLAEEMKKAFPASAARVEAGATAWSPRMRATLTGQDFEITPLEGKDFNGVKDLSMIARTEWGWTLVPKLPGKKQLHLLLAVVLPPELGAPRELPALNRDVEVEVSVWWLIDHYWDKYWKWLLSGLGGALAAAFGWWWKKRPAGSAG